MNYEDECVGCCGEDCGSPGCDPVDGEEDTMELAWDEEDEEDECGPDCEVCNPPAFGGDEYRPEENPFDRFDDDDDCDCDLCQNNGSEPAPDDLEPSPFVGLAAEPISCLDIPAAECESYGECIGCPAEIAQKGEPLPSCGDISMEECESYGDTCEGCPGNPGVSTGGFDSADKPMQPDPEPLQVLVTQLPGDEYPTVYRYNTDEEKKNALTTMFGAFTEDDNFDLDSLVPTVRDVVFHAIITEEYDDVRNAMYALVSVIPFYVVNPE